MNKSILSTFVMVVVVFAGACTPSPAAGDSFDSSSARAVAATPASEAVQEPVETGSKPALADPGSKAEIGKPAPSFTLPDETGKPVSLETFKGKLIVLEWFNPDCPFVVASHERGSMKATMKKAAEGGAVWLAINSAAPGKQGHGSERNVAARKQWNLNHPVLIDEVGDVGRAYGAQRTPHMYVIDENGVLVYAGAIDNSPDGARESPKDGKIISFVEEALDDVAAKKPVKVPSTEPYGCTVKYES